MHNWIAKIMDRPTVTGAGDHPISVPLELSEFIASCRHLSVGGQFYEGIAPSCARLYFVLHGKWTLTTSGVAAEAFANDAILMGPTSRASGISSSGGSLVVLEISAIGWLKLVSAPAHIAANQLFRSQLIGNWSKQVFVPAMAPQSSEAVALTFDTAGIKHFRASPRETLVRYIASALNAGSFATVDQLAQSAGISSRRLYRCCIDAFGFGPKTLLKRQRLLRGLQNMHAVSSHKIADIVPLDYFDQSHFNRDFKSVMGATPTEYRRHASNFLPPLIVSLEQRSRCGEIPVSSPVASVVWSKRLPPQDRAEALR
ncbi:hypothetical protein BH11PSE5_BH11PSE5_21290 [soil metagenome]